jgi:hypothetical protein
VIYFKVLSHGRIKWWRSTSVQRDPRPEPWTSLILSSTACNLSLNQQRSCKQRERIMLADGCVLGCSAMYIATMTDAVRTTETLVNLQQSTRCYRPEHSHLHTHRRENRARTITFRPPHDWRLIAVHIPTWWALKANSAVGDDESLVIYCPGDYTDQCTTFAVFFMNLLSLSWITFYHPGRRQGNSWRQRNAVFRNTL